MLIPLEQPYLQGLNSYYLKIDKFVEHLQGEIGSGCLYFKSQAQELLIYFDEQDILRGIMQDTGAHARVSPTLKPVLEALNQRNFQVSVYYLDPNAIFFWEQMPAFKRAQKEFTTTDISLAELAHRFQEKQVSGFVQVRCLEGKKEALLFFHNGKRIGGSYSDGRGGLDPAESTYQQLLSHLENNQAVLSIGNFIKAEKTAVQLAEKKQIQQTTESDTAAPDNEPFFSNLDTALEEFIAHFVKVLRKKTKVDPVLLLKQNFTDNLEKYPFLDPFKAVFDYADGHAIFAPGAPHEQIAAAVVECVWEVIAEHRLEKKFMAVLKKWDYKSALEERDIVVMR